jgi:hypothetical protein
MAEYGGIFLWNRSLDRPPGAGPYVMDPLKLGVSARLIERLAACNDEWEEMAYSNVGFESPEIEQAWVRRGRDLAIELQGELPDILVLYHHGPKGERPVRPRRG